MEPSVLVLPAGASHANATITVASATASLRVPHCIATQ